MDKKEKQSTRESKYVQQHLANERTFLAWIRSAIAMIGLGYIAVKLHFVFPRKEYDFFAKTIGIISVVIGLTTILFATFDYFRKGKAINSQTFIPTTSSVWIYSVGSFVIGVLFFMYLFFL